MALLVMLGGMSVLTLMTKLCVAFGFTPLLAVSVMVPVAPALGGVPDKTLPFSESHAGNPLALKPGAGEPVIVTV
jgi:hypothetical protein